MKVNVAKERAASLRRQKKKLEPLLVGMRSRLDADPLRLRVRELLEADPEMLGIEAYREIAPDTGIKAFMRNAFRPEYVRKFGHGPKGGPRKKQG